MNGEAESAEEPSGLTGPLAPLTGHDPPLASAGRCRGRRSVAGTEPEQAPEHASYEL
jgi:hypothetical protein